MVSSRLVMVASLALLGATSVEAQTLFWTNNTSDFATAANWGGTVPGPSNIAAFSATPTVQPVLGTNLSVAGLRFQGNVTLTGTGTLTIGANGLENLSPGASSVAIPLVFGGTASTIQNNDTLTLSGPIANDTTSGLTANGLGSTTISGVISGGGKLIKSGTGTVTLSGNNTYTGTTTIESGTLAISADNNLGAAPGSATPDHLTLNGGTLLTSGDVTLSANRGVTLGAAGGTIHVATTSTTTSYGGVIAGNGSLTKLGGGTLTLGGANTFSGGIAINAGQIVVSSDANLGAAAGFLALNNGVLKTTDTFTLGATRTVSLGTMGTGSGFSPGTGTTLTYNGNISGAGGLTKYDNGTLVLGGANTFTGGTNIIVGTLTLANAAALQNSTLNYTATGGTLSFGSLSGATLGGLAGDKNLALTNASAVSVTLTVGKNNQNTTYSGVLSGPGSWLVKSGTGTLVLGGVNTYTGNTTINEGRLQLSANGALPAGGNVVLQPFFSANGTLDLAGTSQTIGSLTFSGGSGPATSTVTLGSGTLTLGGSVIVEVSSNPVGANLSGGTLNLGSSTRTFNIGDSTNAGGMAQPAELSVSSVIAGAGGITKTGAGTLFLSGANTYTGTTTINDGRLQIGSGGSLGSGANVVVNQLTPGPAATFDVGSGSVSVNNLTLGGAGAMSTSSNIVTSGGSGVLTLTGTLTYDATNNPLSGSISGGGTLNLVGARTFAVGDSTSAPFSDLSVSITVTGTGGIVKTGAGGLGLSNSANSYTGDTSIMAGTLSVSQPGALGATSGGTIVASGATLSLNNVGIGAEPLTLSGTGMTGAGALISTGFSPVSASGTVTLAGNTTIGVLGGTGGTLMLQGPIGESGGAQALTKSGFGTLWLTGSNSYTGGTIVNQGTLQLSGSGTLPSGGNVVINSNTGLATLDLGGTSQSIGTLTFGGASATSTTNNHVVLGSGILTLGGNVTFDATANPFAAIIAGGQVFQGMNPFGGTLGLGTATRTFNVADSLSTPVDLTIYSNITGGSGVGLIKSGPGTLVLGGQSTYQGDTVVSAGTLSVASNSIVDGGVIAGPVGRGTLVLQAGTTLATGGLNSNYAISYGQINVGNAVSIADNVTLGSTTMFDHLELNLSGLVTAAAANTTIHLGGYPPVFLTGGLTGAAPGTAITFDSGGRPDRGLVILGGTTMANVGSITANNAGVIFGAPAAISTTGTVHAVNGYIGVAAANAGSVPSPNALLARITNQAGFSGTFGFDTNEDVYNFPYNFTENLDFSAFGSAFTIGSGSAAILSGVITPSASTGYQFGNGGGVLVVRSNLGDVGGAKSVSVSSNATLSDNLLAVIFQGNNTFTGNLSVTNSYAILDSASALPLGRTFSLGANGYLGYTQAFTGAANFTGFRQRLTTYDPTSILGVDSQGAIASMTGGDSSQYVRVVSEPLDLSPLGPIYLGTSTFAAITGQVLPPAATGTLKLAAVGGGFLDFRSTLTAANVPGGVVIGTGAAGQAAGSIEMSGRNTYSAGTTLLGGTLVVKGSTAVSGGTILSGPLGTGPLTIGSAALYPTLAPGDSDFDTVLHNVIRLGSSLQLGFPEGSGGGTLAAAAYIAPVTKFILSGIISDLGGSPTGSLDIYANTVLLGANTFSGGVNLHAGELTIGHNTALGTGTLNLQPFGDSAPVSLRVSGGPRTISNLVTLNLFSDNWLEIGGYGSLTFTNQVTLGSSVNFATNRHSLQFNGGVGGFGRLGVDGYGPVLVNGTNTYSGGTHASHGAIIFGSAASIPTGGFLSADLNGYVGVASATMTSLQSNFIDRFSKTGTIGTIGFDTPAGGASTAFSGGINLTGFSSSTRLGSATSAVLTGPIIPQGATYQFGGGGGLLEVNSILSNPVGGGLRGVQVQSPSLAPLTLRLGGANTFTGAMTVSGSAVIFKPGAIPEGGATWTVLSGGYVGTEDAGLSPATFLARINPGSFGAIVGFDSFSGSANITNPIDLSATFNLGGDPRIFLGTATNALLAGAITLPAGQTAYRFAGYKGGQLRVTTVLDGARSVEIGDPNTPATFGNPADVASAVSSVTLSGTNTYSGGTVLYAGELRAGRNSALGTGTLSVIVSNDFGGGHPTTPFLGVSASSDPTTGAQINLPNAISLSGSDLNLTGLYAFTLSGTISGNGELYKLGSNTVTLAPVSGANTFSGGVYVAQGNVTFATANAIGTGPLRLGGPLGPSATFLENMTVNGIAGDSPLDQITLLGGKTLTVNQTFDATYAGIFAGTGVSFVFTGPDAANHRRLFLPTASSYTGSTAINSGVTIIAGNSAAFGATTNTVTLNGGKLIVDPGVILSHALTLNAGALGGAGTFSPAATLQIKTGLTLAPGGHLNPGTLTFSDRGPSIGTVLSLENGGTYRWRLADATDANTGWDQINVVGALGVTAAAGTPFTFRIEPAGPLDLLGVSILNFNPTQAYSWSVLSATSINGFAANAFAIDSSAMASLIGGGSFNFSLGSNIVGPGTTSLMLNFTPAVIPEPSTYVLIGLGALVIVGMTRRRRR